MKLIFVVLSSAICLVTFGQDGSDILYFKPAELNNSHIGKNVHLDFYNKSYHGLRLDTINISVNGNLILFKERRKDDGFNNWFLEQYLESVESINGLKLRLEKSQIKKITNDSLLVTNYFNFYNSESERLLAKSFLIDNWFSKNLIVEVLVTNK